MPGGLRLAGFFLKKMATTPQPIFGDPAAIAWHRRITEAMRGERAFATSFEEVSEETGTVKYRCPMCGLEHHIDYFWWRISRRQFIVEPDCRPISLTLREGQLWVLQPENPPGEAR